MTNGMVVSVVMPVYNEERYIEKCVDSLLLQDYPIDEMEWIFVDGCSKDRTVEILKRYQEKYPSLIKIYSNPDKIVPYAMNIGIAASKGKYIVRLDAHADYATDYISKCVYYLENTDAENVGGIAETKANGFMGKAIAKMLSSKFGVGNSQFRTNGESGYVDTVPFGAFRRDVFSKYGGYDERLVRNQDNEMNFRIRKNGGKIYLANDIRFSYYCRDSIGGISTMARKNGMWNIITMKLCPGSMGVRHFIPFAFVISVLGLGILSFIHLLFAAILAAEISLYLLLDIVFSIKQAETLREFFTLLILFPIFHVAYGVGSLIGITKLFSKKFKRGNYENKKI